MKLFVSLYLVVAFTCNLLDADEYTEVKKIVLQKDEQKNFLVKFDNQVKLFKFRWTLYVNDRLTILRSYDTHVAQNILALNYHNQSFRVRIKPRGASNYNAPYILVKFTKFDFKKHTATFELYLYENRENIWLEELKNNEETR